MLYGDENGARKYTQMHKKRQPHHNVFKLNSTTKLFGVYRPERTQS